MAINPLLSIGTSGLFASQACIQTTGNNIANVNTPGYSRQGVNLEDSLYIDGRPGQVGTGVTATDVFRYFDKFVEAQYNSKASTTVRYGTLWSNLKGVESLFNEANTEGINNSLARFFNDWQTITQKPDDIAARQTMLSDTQSLVMLINQREKDLALIDSQINEQIQTSVDQVNTILKRIADLNGEISAHTIENQNNPNGMLDERDQLIRLLAEKMDVVTQENSYNGMVTVRTTAGQPLVEGTSCYEVKYEGPQASQNLTIGSPFTGEIEFSGSDGYEYMVEIVNGGDVGGVPPATFRVSLDGGQTWIKDDNGADRLFEAHELDNKVKVGNLEISFTAGETLASGDRFNIVPKNGVYWYKNTSTKENITTQIYPNGQDNPDRMVGGEIAGYLELRDRCVAEYREQLNSMAKSLAWEVNRLHSQGSGLHHLNDAMGSYKTNHTDIPLADPRAGMVYGEYLDSGNLMTYIYDSSGKLVPGASGPLDFDALTAGVQNFDPDVHSLEDVRDAFNGTYGTYLTAEIIDGRMHIRANEGFTFGFGTDTTGLLAAMGINTFFTGSTAADLAVNNAVATDPELVNAGAINGASESNEGDAVTAQKIAELLTKQVNIMGRFGVSFSQSLSGYYGSTVSKVGSDTSNASFAYQYNYALATDLNNRQQAVAGVNLNEELTNLIKFQHSFTAASKLVTTADQMLQTILSLKQ